MEQVLHAISVSPERWHVVDCQRFAGIGIYTRESMITRIADLIGEGLIYSLTIGANSRVFVDRSGNVWIDHEYLAPHQYLPKLIPEETADG